MGWKTILINSEQHLKIENNNLIINSNKEKISFFLDDIDIVLIDNFKTNITIPAILELTNRNIALIINNYSHDPHTLMLPLSGHHKPLQNFSKQLELTLRDKQKFHQQIIKQKIKNQRNVMEDLDVKNEFLDKMDLYMKQVNQGDPKNREASAARLFFNCLYGFSFVRFSDDAINKSLNYGYKILASKISSSLIKYGLNPSLGFFHKTSTNYFNLTYDLIEPFRPLIDWITVKNNDFLTNDEDILNLQVRIKLIKVLDYYVLINNKVTKVRNAIDIMCKSVISCLVDNYDNLLLPEIFLNFDNVDENIENGII